MALPAAVINFVLTEKYGKDPELAASIVVLSTFISLFTTPIVFDLVTAKICVLIALSINYIDTFEFTR